MVPWQRLAQAEVLGEKVPLVLSRREAEFAIRIGSRTLMGSRAHGSEEALAELACARIAVRTQARVLIGGLGMGYTLAAALRQLAPSAQVATNDWLYSDAGLGTAFVALRVGGVLGVWSVAPDRAFPRRLGQVGFGVEEEFVRARRTKGGRHTLWLGTRPGG